MGQLGYPFWFGARRPRFKTWIQILYYVNFRVAPLQYDNKLKEIELREMAKKTLKLGLGARYGRTTREKYAKIGRLQKQKYKCPYCSQKKVKRVSIGIWNCTKCGAKFTSKAYYVPSKKDYKSQEHTLIEETKETEKKETKEEKGIKYKDNNNVLPKEDINQDLNNIEKETKEEKD